MDPFTAIGLAGNILTFVDFGIKLVSEAKNIHTSVSGTSAYNDNLSSKTQQLQQLTANLKAARTASSLSTQQASFLQVAAECEGVSADLTALLEKLKARDPKSRREAFKAAIRDRRKKDKKTDLELKLERCRQQLNLELLSLTRSESLERLNKLIEHGQASEDELKSLRKNVESLRLGSNVSCLGPEALAQIRSLLNRTDDAVLKVRQARVLDGLRFEMMNERFEDIEDAHYKTFDWIFDDDASDSEEWDTEDETTSEISDETDEDLEDRSDHDPDIEHDESSRRASQLLDEHSEGHLVSAGRPSSLADRAQSSTDNDKDGVQDDHAMHFAREKGSVDNSSFEWSVDGDLPAEDDQPSFLSNSEIPVKSTESPTYSHSLPRAPLEEALVKARDSFITWLEQGTGIFHILGKPGSGKSTLMKYLARNSKTESHLRVWAGEKQLVLGKFFFWKPGSALQKTIKGLARGLLHCLLAGCPDLIPLAFPVQWEASMHRETVHIEHHECEPALKKLIADNRGFGEHRFALFIDGLDEFEGDHAYLARQLVAWTKESQNVKLCVSSRELAIFQDNLQGYPKLRLHDLTRSDIRRFVGGRLREMDFSTRINNDDNGDYYYSYPPRDKATQLRNTIVEASDGVFLWVSLVLRRVDAGLANGDQMGDLMGIVESLPTELESMLRQLLDSIPPHNQRLAYSMLSLTHFCIPYDSRVTLMQCSFLEEYIEDRDFAMGLATRQFTTKETERRLERAQKRIYGVGMGLLELRRQGGRFPSKLSNALGSMVHLTHRSIAELLESRHFEQERDSKLPNFDPFDAYCQTWLGQLNRARLPKLYFAPRIVEPRVTWTVYGDRHVHSLFSYSFVPSFRQDVELRIVQHTDLGQPETTSRFCKFLDCTYRTAVDSKIRIALEYSTWHTNLTGTLSCGVEDLVILACTHLGFHEGLLLRRDLSEELISCCISVYLLTLPEGMVGLGMWSRGMEMLRRGPEVWCRGLKTLQVLLDRGASPDSNLRPDLEPAFHHLCWSWCCFRYQPSLAVIALMLFYGANPRFTLHISNTKLKETATSDLFFEAYGTSEHPVSESEHGVETVLSELSSHLYIRAVDAHSEDIITKRGRTIDLRTLVSIWFPGQSHVLQQVIDWILELGVPVDACHRLQLQSRFGHLLRPFFDQDHPGFIGWEPIQNGWPCGSLRRESLIEVNSDDGS
ncbi:hypothetical protein F4677DRAFT_189452 [Hypoxylon crocopeplum]|nr:hypothetical protein F4677DRAFT_189452 [Hypoxylon crocopeplum]